MAPPKSSKSNKKDYQMGPSLPRDSPNYTRRELIRTNLLYLKIEALQSEDEETVEAVMQELSKTDLLESSITVEQLIALNLQLDRDGLMEKEASEAQKDSPNLTRRELARRHLFLRRLRGLESEEVQGRDVEDCRAELIKRNLQEGTITLEESTKVNLDIQRKKEARQERTLAHAKSSNSEKDS